MKEIWWVRHGSTDWNEEKRWQGYTDVPLNERGRFEAECLARRLRGIKFDGVWSSDLSRSMETARIAMPGAEIHPDSRLREIPMGVAEGHVWSELTASQQERIEKWWSDPYGLKFPGTNESLRDTETRLRQWRDELPDGRYLVFTHGGTMRCLMWEITGSPKGLAWTMELGNTGIIRARYDGDLKILVCFNDMSHMENYWETLPAQNVPGAANI